MIKVLLERFDHNLACLDALHDAYNVTDEKRNCSAFPEFL